jgi:hypothetical protein
VAQLPRRGNPYGEAWKRDQACKNPYLPHPNNRRRALRTEDSAAREHRVLGNVFSLLAVVPLGWGTKCVHWDMPGYFRTAVNGGCEVPLTLRHNAVSCFHADEA